MRAAVIPALRWTALGRLSAQALSLLSTLVVVRLLVPADYGLFALCIAPTTFFVALVVVAPTSLTIQRPDLGDARAAEIAGLALLLAVPAFIGIVAALAIIAHGYDEPRVWTVGLALAIGVFGPSCVTALLQSRLERRLEFRLVAMFELAGGAAAAALTILCALGGAGVWSLVAGSCCAALAQCLFLLATGGLPRASFRLGRLLREDARYGAHVTLGTLVTQTLDAAETLLLGRFLGTAGLGAWRTCRELVNVPLGKVMPIVNRVGFPAYARLGGDVAAIRRYALLSLRVLSALFLPIYWGLAAVAPQAVAVILGAQWAGAVPVAILFGVFMPFKLLQYCLILPHQGLGNAALVNRATVTIGVAGIAGLALGAPHGLATAALGMVGCGTLGLAFAVDRARRPLGVSWRDIAAACGASLVAAMAMTAVVTALRVAALPPSWSDAQILLVLVPAGIATYGAVLVAVDRGATMALLGGMVRDIGRRR